MKTDTVSVSFRWQDPGRQGARAGRNSQCDTVMQQI